MTGFSFSCCSKWFYSGQFRKPSQNDYVFIFSWNIYY